LEAIRDAKKGSAWRLADVRRLVPRNGSVRGAFRDGGDSSNFGRGLKGGNGSLDRGRIKDDFYRGRKKILEKVGHA